MTPSSPARALFTVCLFASVACDGPDTKIPTIEVSSEQLAPGGAYITYVIGCEQGCDQLARGDLVLAVDGEAVVRTHDLRAERLTTGAPIKLTVRKAGAEQTSEVVLVARPNAGLPPIANAPPFWAVGAAALDRAPQWARRNLFAHASPMTMLVNADGGITDGRQLVGKKRLILFWDWGTREEQAQAANMLQVLQMAQTDLNAAGVDVMFTQLRFPSNTRTDPMNDSGLRDWQKRLGRPDRAPLPIYRFPNATEYNAARELGLEGSMNYIQYLRQPPAIVLLDADGFVRWHSEGIQLPPPGDPLAGKGKDDQWTIIQAIEFAQTQL